MRSRIIATIGPASDHVDTLAEMMQAGMNIARLNYSHGDFEGKELTIRNIRQAESDTGLHIGCRNAKRHRHPDHCGTEPQTRPRQA